MCCVIMQELGMWVVSKVCFVSLSFYSPFYSRLRNFEPKITDATESDLDRVVKVNINGVFNCAKEAIRVMTSDGKGGVILNTGSCASVHPIKDRVVYVVFEGCD